MTARVRSSRVRADLQQVVSGWSLLVTDTHGRITGGDVQGLFVDGTRVLASEELRFDGSEPRPFSTSKVGAHGQLSYAQLRDGEADPADGAYLVVERVLDEGMRTRLTVLSTAAVGLRFDVDVRLTVDFADIDGLEQGRPTPEVDVEWWEQERLLGFRRIDRLEQATWVRLEGVDDVRFEDGRLRFALDVPARGSVTCSLLVEPELAGARHAAPAGYDDRTSLAAGARSILYDEATRLTSTHPDVSAAWATAVSDLASLPLGEPAGPAAPIAGLPFYQQVFGRDILTVSWQALLATPTLLRDSLRLNADFAGTRIDDWHDEEPGKLLHQARRGPQSILGEDPFDRYYGDWATGPDFLVFLGQYLAWTGDLATVRELVPVARSVLTWLDRYGDLDRDGFLEYRSRSKGGVKNQGWKDSDTAVVDEHGEVVENPIASSELQAYWYAALRHGALALAAIGDVSLAARMVRQAADLRRRFHAAYWMPELGSYAMALGPDGEQVRSVGSNDGHLLAAGIVPRRLAPELARRLMQPDLFSGWGVRTLSADHPAYNPFSYHRGSVWPVEAGTIALGLARYGCWEELHRLAEGTFAAAALFEEHRLPEALSGLPREDYPHPGVYPRACSPQAWSASCVVTVVQALLGLRPAAQLGVFLVDPHLPPWLPDLELHGVQLGGSTCDLRARREGDRTRLRVSGGPVRLLRVPLRRPALTW